MEPDGSFPLAEAAVGQRVVVARVGQEDARLLAYLGGRGLVPGRRLAVREARALDGVVTVEDEDGSAFALGGPLAGTLFVRGASRDDGG